MTTTLKQNHPEQQAGLKEGAADIFAVQHFMLGESERVPFRRLRVDPVRFQVRNLAANTVINQRLQSQQSEKAVFVLTDIVEAGHALDPIIVWQEEGSDDLWVVDGHHRMEALEKAATTPETGIWVQRFNGKTEADARRFALSLNKRTNVNMTKEEVIQELWVMMLCGEVDGSLRDIASTYGVSKTTVGRMKNHIEHVQNELENQAQREGVELTAAMIRSAPPIWRELSAWRDDDQDTELPDLESVVVDRILKKLADHVLEEATHHPEEFREAVQQFALELRLGWKPQGVFNAEDDF